MDTTTYQPSPREIFPTRRDRMIQNFQPGHGWTLFGTTGATFVDDTSDYCLGSQSIRLVTGGAGATHEIRSPVLSAIDLSAQNLALAVKVDSFTHYSDLQLRVSSNGFSDYAYCRPVYTSAGQRWIEPGIWHLLTISRGESVPAFSWNNGGWNYSGAKASVNWSAITGIRFKVVDDTSGSITVRINKLSQFAQPAKAILSLIFDDSRDTHFTVAKSYMDKYGLVATSAVITNVLGTAGYMTTLQVKDLRSKSGWSLIAHAHDNASGNLTHQNGYDGLTLVKGEADILTMKANLNEIGADGSNILALPHGSWSLNTPGTIGANADVLGTVAKHFDAGRTTSSNMFETYPPAHPYKLRSFTPDSSDAPADWLAALDSAIAAKAWAMMQFHNIVASPSVASEVTPTDFRTFIDGVAARVASGALLVRTLHDVLEYGAA